MAKRVGPVPSSPAQILPSRSANRLITLSCGEALSVGRIIAVTYESPLVPVEFEQTGSLRCNPQSAVLIFEHSHHAGQGGGGLFPFVKRIVSERVRLLVKHL